MRARPRRWWRTVLALGAVSVAGIAAALVAVTPAHAIDITGASWSWRYVSAEQFEFAARVGNAVVAGAGSDFGGARSMSVTVDDENDVDGLCAQTTVFGGPQRVTRTVCDNESPVSFGLTDVTGELGVSLRDFDRTTQPFRGVVGTIPDSGVDFGLRVAGTGAFWHYISNDLVDFGVERRGVRMSGVAGPEWSVPGPRRADATVVLTESTGCADGYIKVGDVRVPAWASDCSGAGAGLGISSRSGRFDVSACWTWAEDEGVCLGLHVPHPTSVGADA